jgi:hypothetical protein
MNRKAKRGHSLAWHARHDPHGCNHGTCRADALPGKGLCIDHLAEKNYQDAITGANPRLRDALIRAITDPSRRD